MKRLLLTIIILLTGLLSASAQSAENFPFQLLKAGYGDKGELLIIGRFNRPLAKRTIPHPDFFGDIQLTGQPELKINSKGHFLLIIRQFTYSDNYLLKQQDHPPVEGAFNSFTAPEINVGLTRPCLWPQTGCLVSNVIPVKSCPSYAWVGYPPGQQEQALKELQKLEACRIDTRSWE